MSSFRTSSFQIKNVPKLCLEEAKLHFPKNSQQLILKTAIIGPQPKNSVIIGKLKSYNTRKDVDDVEDEIMKCIFKEVTTESSGITFEVFIEQDDVLLMRPLLEKVGSNPVWVIFSSIYLCKLGTQKKNVLKIDPKTGLTAEVCILYETLQNDVNCDEQLEVHYSSVNEIDHNKTINAFALVKSILKHETVLSNESKHSMFSIIDQSCHEECAIRNDLPVHIFFNNPNEKLPEPIEPGDILRIRALRGDRYKVNARVHGKIFHANAIVKFKLVEKDEEVTPITSCLRYKLTEQDRNMVKRLRQWAKEVDLEKHMQPKEQINDMMICEVTEKGIFNLYCLVTEVYKVKDQDKVVLKVTDGTASNVYVYTTEVNMENDTNEINTQIQHITLNAREVIITVTEKLQEKALKLKEGDFIYLRHVRVSEVKDNSMVDEEKPILDMYMTAENGDIINVPRSKSPYKEILSRLMESDSLYSMENDDSETMAAVKEHLQLGSSVNLNETHNKGSEKDEQETTVYEEKEESSKTKGKRSLETNACEENEGSPKLITMEKELNSPELSKHLSPHSKFAHFFTDCPQKYRWENSLTNFCKNAEPDEKWVVWALVKRVYLAPIDDEATGVSSVPNWVWGLCVVCGYSIPPSDIQKLYSKKDLQGGTKTFPCTGSLCTARYSSVTPSKAKNSVEPYFKLRLGLKDLSNDGSVYLVDLNGDGAETFFGCQPYFQWIVGESIPDKLRRINEIFQDEFILSKHPFQFCVVKRKLPEGTYVTQIDETVFQFS